MANRRQHLIKHLFKSQKVFDTTNIIHHDERKRLYNAQLYKVCSVDSTTTKDTILKLINSPGYFGKNLGNYLSNSS